MRLFALLLAQAVLAAGGGPKPADLELRSGAFQPGGWIPERHSCEGKDLSPPLSWSGPPEGTRSFALIMDDPDAPPGVWVHWVLYDIPGNVTGLKEGLARRKTLPDGARQGVSWGVEEFDRLGYYGPCPPPGSPHRYSFRLYALDKAPGLAPKATKARLLEAMEGHILGQAELTGLYKR